jgi:OOP family OmpA-OmpF porin
MSFYYLALFILLKIEGECMRKTVLLASVGLLTVTSLASAANREGQFSVSPVIGGYMYEGKKDFNTEFMYGVRAGYNLTKHFGIEALFDATQASPGKSDSPVDLYRYGGELLYHFFPDNTFVPYLATGFSGLNFDAKGDFGKVRGAFDYGIGAKYFLCDSFALRGDVRHILYEMKDWSNNNLEYTLGAYIPFGGVKPAAKPVAAPPAPAPAPVPVPSPAPVPKAVEPPPPAPVPPARPTVSLSASSPIFKGDPAVLSWRAQNATACDLQPGIGAVPPQGARPVSPAENIAYSITCSGAGGTAKSTANIVVVAPPPPPVVAVPQPKASVAAEKFCSKPAIINIQFDTNKSDIKQQYVEELKAVSEFLKEFPKAKGEISGHTDNVGGKEFNEKLSQRRAESVKKYIVDSFGISAERITAKGYGFSKPVVSNKTKEGKAKNRRIEANFTCE